MKQEVILTEKSIPKAFKKWYLEVFSENRDKIDVVMEYDRTCSVAENQTVFLDKFRNFVNENKRFGNLVNQTKSADEKFKIEQLSKIMQEEKELIENWKKSEHQEINIKSFEEPKDLIKLICSPNSIMKGVILIGESSLGKTFLTINTLKEIKFEDYEWIRTYVTPLELYKMLYYKQREFESKLGENPFFILVFDDTEGLLTNTNSVSIIKSALRGENNSLRIVEYNSTRLDKENIPKHFKFTGHIIIIANKVNLKDKNVFAIKERTHFKELNFSYKEKIKILKQSIKNDYESTTLELRQRALDMVIKNTDVITQDLNFVTLLRAYDYLIYDERKAEILLKSTLKIDEDLKLVKELMEGDKVVTEQIKEFDLKRGKSRATFFRLKEEVKRLMK